MTKKLSYNDLAVISNLRMKNKIIFAILLFTIFSTFSQEKKRLFYDEELNEISKKQFLRQIDYGKNLDLYFENDSIISSLLVKRKKYGKLTTEEYNGLSNNISPFKELESELIIIVYYPGKDRCNGMERISTWNIFDSDYEEKLKKINSVDQFWVYKNSENLKYYHTDQVDWRKDKNQLVENLFFEFHYPCSSAVVIDNEGNYISYFGEFGKQTIWKIAKEISKN